MANRQRLTYECPECGRELRPSETCPECGKKAVGRDLLHDEALRSKRQEELKAKYGAAWRLYK